MSTTQRIFGRKPGSGRSWPRTTVRPLWGTLSGVKRGGSHLFLRYAFATEEKVRGAAFPLPG